MAIRNVIHIIFIIICNSTALGLDLVPGDLSGREGEQVEVCVVVTKGSNQLDSPIEVMISITDITTSGKLQFETTAHKFHWLLMKRLSR